MHDKNLTLLDLLAFKYRLIKESPNIDYFYKNNKLQSLFDAFRAIHSSDIKDIFPSSIDAYTVAFIISGMDGITNLWLQNGKLEDTKQMALLTAQIIKKHLESLHSKFDLCLLIIINILHVQAYFNEHNLNSNRVPSLSKTLHLITNC